jgi:hypothetical protein
MSLISFIQKIFSKSSLSGNIVSDNLEGSQNYLSFFLIVIFFVFAFFVAKKYLYLQLRKRILAERRK